MKYSDEFQPGDRLGKYEIIRELATGGMATIYLARVSGTAGFEKLLVLKCILPGLAKDQGFLTMFLDEARLAAQLRHANIADVFDVGVEGGTYFFAMEYVHGQNARAIRIEARRRELPIPLEVSLAIVSGTAAALGYAHERTGPDGPLGLVHRDISPSNVLVSLEGAVKLVDFGIARATMRRGAKTRTGLRKGKAPYMSPEQCRGAPLDGRSDLFSLGTMFYELTTGVRPFQGTSDFDVMDSIVRGVAQPPSLIAPGYPVELELIVLRLLASQPQDRYQSAAALLDDLDEFITSAGMLTSAHVVARYMRELFGDTGSSTELDTITDVGPEPEPVRELRDADLEPTLPFKREDHMWTSELMRTSRPKRPSTQPPFADEQTRRDVMPAFDPIDARAVDIVEQLDAGAPDDESPMQRATRRINALVAQAQVWLARGEGDKAVTAIVLALEEDLHVPGTQRLLMSHMTTIVGVYEAMLEDPYRKLFLTRPLHEVVAAPVDERARTLLPLIDGEATIRDLLARSGMVRLELYHHLCQLLLRGLIA